jgi:hypothetical protein
MDIVFNYPLCGQHLSVEERGAEMLVNCPSCQEQIGIPRSTVSQPPKIPVPATVPLVRQQQSEANSFKPVMKTAFLSFLGVLAAGLILFALYIGWQRLDRWEQGKNYWLAQLGQAHVNTSRVIPGQYAAN